MPLFLTILDGATPDEAQPILAIRDPQILATVRAMVHARLTEEHPGKVVALAEPHIKAVQRRGPRSGLLESSPPHVVQVPTKDEAR